MAGTVYLRTNRFEVKLEGITFKTKDFEYLCNEDFLFPKGKIRVHKPIVGIDVMQHPRDPNIVLVLLCFGLGCVILRFHSGEALPDPILKFLADERICFVGFGIPEKRDLFPFEQLGFSKQNSDIGYLASRFFNNPKYKKCDLGDLARKVLGIKRMIGLTDSSSFERHEQIKCGICQLFISTIIAISLLSAVERKKVKASPSPSRSPTPSPPKKGSFLKNLAFLPFLSEGLLKVNEGKLRDQTNNGMDSSDDDHNDDDDSFWGKEENEDVSYEDVFVCEKDDQAYDYIKAQGTESEDTPKTNSEDDDDDYYPNKESKTTLMKGIFKCLFPVDMKIFNLGNASSMDFIEKETICAPKNSPSEEDGKSPSSSTTNETNSKNTIPIEKKPLKGILKCQSSTFDGCNSMPSSKPGSPPNAQELKRANFKVRTVSFKCD
ncbi:unnamed protein product [Cuscuta epithymum]|uniref:Uncharacterized protein n=1 Tax=Cuscuta epithymum TaxID=186058 RepID=A0AAV0EM72_9ASTE|nr:unnamed protein product [Cuscuta epithymum]